MASVFGLRTVELVRDDMREEAESLRFAGFAHRYWLRARAEGFSMLRFVHYSRGPAGNIF